MRQPTPELPSGEKTCSVYTGCIALNSAISGIWTGTRRVRWYRKKDLTPHPTPATKDQVALGNASAILLSPFRLCDRCVVHHHLASPPFRSPSRSLSRQGRRPRLYHSPCVHGRASLSANLRWFMGGNSNLDLVEIQSRNTIRRYSGFASCEEDNHPPLTKPSD